MRSPKRRRASTTRRDLPMPDSPVIETIAPLPSAIASQASSSTASSALRPTSGTIARTWASPRAPVTRATRSGRSIPRSSTSPSDSSSTHSCDLALRLRADDDAAVGRELLQARGDIGGVAERVVAVVALVVVREHDRARVERDAHGQLHAVAAAQLLAVGAIASWIASAARTARSASSSCPTGAPNTANSPSPSSCATVPSKRRTSAPISETISSNRNLERSGPDLLADRGRADDVGEQDRDDALGSRACYHRHEL